MGANFFSVFLAATNLYVATAHAKNCNVSKLLSAEGRFPQELVRTLVDSKNTKVLDAVEFLEAYASPKNHRRGYLLGLANSVSEGFNIYFYYTAVTGLRHFERRTGDFASFAEHLYLETSEPIVFLIPADNFRYAGHSQTRREFQRLLELVNEDDHERQISLVFGAYQFVPAGFLPGTGINGEPEIEEIQRFREYIRQVIPEFEGFNPN